MAEYLEVDLQSPFASGEGRRIFQRMISEELTRNRVDESDQRLSKSKRKKQRKKSKSNVETREDEDESDETYYTPPESPHLSSEEECSLTDTVDGVGSEDFLRELQSQSVHSKKKKRHDSRQEERDLFLPLLERMNSSDNPRISDLDISPASELPSLTEICLSVVLQNSLSGYGQSPPIAKHLKSRFKGVDVDTSGRLLKWGWSALNQYEKLEKARQRDQPWSPDGPTVFTWHKELFNAFHYYRRGIRPYVKMFTIHVPFLPVTVLGSPWYYRLVHHCTLWHDWDRPPSLSWTAYISVRDKIK